MISRTVAFVKQPRWAASSPDRSDWLTSLRPYARKPSGLPVTFATRHVVLDLNHRDVAGMMDLSGAREWLEDQAPFPGAAHPPVKART
jgi:hypothetical protein